MTSPNDMFSMADGAPDEELAKAVRDPMSSNISQIAALDTLMKRSKMRNQALAAQPKSQGSVADSHLREMGFSNGGLVPSYAVGGKVRPAPTQAPQRAGGSGKGKGGGKQGGTHTEMVQPTYDPHMYDPNFKDTSGWIGGAPPPPVATQVQNPQKGGPFGAASSTLLPGGIATNGQSQASIQPVGQPEIINPREANERNFKSQQANSYLNWQSPASQVYTPNPSAAASQIAQPTVASTPVAAPVGTAAQPVQSTQTASTMANNAWGSTQQPLAQPPKSFSYANGGTVGFSHGGLTKNDIRDMAYSAAMEAGVNPATFYSLVMHESSGNTHARGPSIKKFKGTPDEYAIGLTQLLPSTAREVGVKDLKDPYDQLAGGARYLKKMQDKFGTEYDGLRAYNAGPANATKYDSISHDYASKILKDAGRGFSKGSDAGLGYEQLRSMEQAMGNVEVPQIKPVIPRPVDVSKRGLMSDYEDMLFQPAGDPLAGALQESADRAAQVRGRDFERSRPDFAGMAAGGLVRHYDGSGDSLVTSIIGRKRDEELEAKAAAKNSGLHNKMVRMGWDKTTLDDVFNRVDQPLPFDGPNRLQLHNPITGEAIGDGAMFPNRVAEMMGKDISGYAARKGKENYELMQDIGKTLNSYGHQIHDSEFAEGVRQATYDVGDTAVNTLYDIGAGYRNRPSLEAVGGQLHDSSKRIWNEGPKHTWTNDPSLTAKQNINLNRRAEVGNAGSNLLRGLVAAPVSGLAYATDLVAGVGGMAEDLFDYGTLPDSELKAKWAQYNKDHPETGKAAVVKNGETFSPARGNTDPVSTTPATTPPKPRAKPAYNPNGDKPPAVEKNSPSQDESSRDTLSTADSGAGRGTLEEFVRGLRPDTSAKELRLAARHEENLRLARLQAGLGIAAGGSQYFARNLIGAAPAIEGYQRGEAGIDQERDQIDSRNDNYNNALITAKSGDLQRAQQYKMLDLETQAKIKERTALVREQLAAKIEEIKSRNGLSTKNAMEFLAKSDSFGMSNIKKPDDWDTMSADKQLAWYLDKAAMMQVLSGGAGGFDARGED